MATNRWITNATLRRFMLGSGPLKRASDRLEVLARVLLVCSVLTAVPIALTVGSEIHTRAELEAVAETASRHQADATLVEDVPPTEGGAEAGVVESPASAAWSGPDGAERRGTVSAAAGAKAGSTVSVWLDAQGARTKQPLSEGNILARTVGWATLTLLVTSGLAFVGHLLFRTALNWSRLRRWAREWATVEPGWTHRVP